MFVWSYTSFTSMDPFSPSRRLPFHYSLSLAAFIFSPVSLFYFYSCLILSFTPPFPLSFSFSLTHFFHSSLISSIPVFHPLLISFFHFTIIPVFPSSRRTATHFLLCIHFLSTYFLFEPPITFHILVFLYISSFPFPFSFLFIISSSSHRHPSSRNFILFRNPFRYVVMSFLC